MASFLKLIVTLTALVCLVSAVPLASVEIPPPVGILKFPHEDDFYSAPHGYENATLGSILRHRRVPNPLSLDNKIPLQVKDAWQIQYRSQNSIGEAEAAIVTVLVPYNFRPGNLFVYGYYTVRVMSFSMILSKLILSIAFAFPTVRFTPSKFLKPLLNCLIVAASRSLCRLAREMTPLRCRPRQFFLCKR